MVPRSYFPNLHKFLAGDSDQCHSVFFLVSGIRNIQVVVPMIHLPLCKHKSQGQEQTKTTAFPDIKSLTSAVEKIQIDKQLCVSIYELFPPILVSFRERSFTGVDNLINQLDQGA